MTLPPVVSVIMANHNGEAFIGQAIRSVQDQSLRDWELVIVDDASSDRSVDVALGAAGGDPRVHILRQHANSGPGAARNRAIQEAQGQWIAVFDSDDLMPAERLQRLVGAACEHRAAVVADNLMLFTEADPRPRPMITGAWAREPRWIGLCDLIDSSRLYAKAPDLGYLKPLFRADAVAQQGLRYDETLRIGEDYHFLAGFLARGRRLYLDPHGAYLYRKHEGSISHRMKASHLCALLCAEDRFVGEFGPFTAFEQAALARRRRSLESMLAYDCVVDALKTDPIGRGIGLAVSTPRVWPLLTRPVKARVRRLLRRRASEGRLNVVPVAGQRQPLLAEPLDRSLQRP